MAGRCPRPGPDRPAREDAAVRRRRASWSNLSEWFNVDKLSEELVGGFVDLGPHSRAASTACSTRPTSSRSCGTRSQAFEDAGYAVPTTWDELIALSDQIIADGNGNPWCIGSRAKQPTDGWPPTGWRTSCCAPRRRRSTPSGTTTRSLSTHPEVLEAAE